MSSKIINISTPTNDASSKGQKKDSNNKENIMWTVLFSVGHFVVLVLMLLVFLGR